MVESRETIAGYEILEAIGETVWGETYRARQKSLDRTVFLTLIPPVKEAATVHEKARRCASLTHPHLVSGIDFGEEEGRTYLVTEWAEGPTIGDIVRRGGPIAEERALEITLAASHALAHAAAAGLGHGRITPEAIVIVSGGNPKLRGFGPDMETTISPLDWRAPEVRRGERISRKSDVYSLGAVLYWMLTGQHPLEDAPPPAVVNDIVVEVPVPVRQRNRRLNPETAELVEQLLAWRPEDRPPHAAAMAEAIDALITKLDERVDLRSPRGTRLKTRRPRPSRPRRRRRR